MTITIESFLERAPKLLADWQPEHTPIQLEYFVIENSGCGDVYGRYVQAMRELDGRCQGLQAMEMQQESLELALEEARIDLKEATEAETKNAQGTQGRRVRLAVKKAGLAVRLAQAAIDADAPRRRAALREAATVLELATQAREGVGDLTPERRTELEWDFIAARFAQKIQFQRMAGVAIGEEIMLSIRHFPEDRQKTLIEALGTQVGKQPEVSDPMHGALRLAFASKDRRDKRNAAAIAGSG